MYKPLNMFTKQTDELKQLISEHPDYPIVVLCNYEVCGDDSYCWWYAPEIRFSIGEILDCEHYQKKRYSNEKNAIKSWNKKALKHQGTSQKKAGIIMKKYNVKLIMEYTKILADTEEEAIERAKYEFDGSNDSSFRQRWDKVQCEEIKAESEE